MKTIRSASEFVADHPKPAKHFSWHEVRCRHCFKLPPVKIMSSDRFKLVGRIADTIRDSLGRPVVATSWWRCANHPIEKAKSEPGAHYYGMAVDLAMSGREPLDAIMAVMAGRGMTNADMQSIEKNVGFGLRMHGPEETRFMHIDIAGCESRWMWLRPRIWTYPK